MLAESDSAQGDVQAMAESLGRGRMKAGGVS
jgi:hypothetical protein